MATIELQIWLSLVNKQEWDTLASADPEGGAGSPDPPPPWKITSYMGFYRE